MRIEKAKMKGGGLMKTCRNIRQVLKCVYKKISITGNYIYLISKNGLLIQCLQIKD